MALDKQPVNINFGQGLDTKTDPYQLAIGKFLTLSNSVFTTANRLSKRNGFQKLTSLPNAEQTTLTTLNDNLLATGSNLYALSAETNMWLDQGTVQPIQLNVKSLVRNSYSQSGVDASVTSNGLTCLVYMQDSTGYYQIVDSNTGQQIVEATKLANTAMQPRVFLLGRYFIITFTATVSAASHLQYIAIPISTPNSPSATFDISTTLNDLDKGYDGFVSNNTLYVAYEDSTGVSIVYLTSTLVLSSSVSLLAEVADIMSVTADESGSTPIIWIAYWDSGSTNGYVASFSSLLVPILTPTQIIDTTIVNEITSIATNGSVTVFYETDNDYASPYPVSNVQSDFISKVSVTEAGSVGSTAVILRSVGLASKAFIAESDTVYMLATYGEENQPTYFLIDSDGNIYMRLAYANGGGYESTQVLPSISIVDGEYLVPYLIKDFLTTVNKGTNLPSGTPTNALYTQTGINLAKFTINNSGQLSSEIANTLHLTGGQLWMYDAVAPVEHSFHVWPENVASETTAGAGDIEAGTYYYVFTYEWTDNQGNLHRSAPSIPIVQTTTTISSTNTLYVPNLRLTYKTNVRIVGYRWSAAQQVYYQFTSVTSPTLNDPTQDFTVITDTFSDADILGQTLLYTTGGVIENIAAPASIASTLYKNRLFLIDAEDRNLLWYSKQVIENVPVEMSDLFTLFVAPTTGAQGSTGPMTAISAMDDKLIIFKRNAIYYMTGDGPDNTGANNDFSNPVFVTSSVGCTNPQSIVLMPNGLMFQSDKGIWLLGRDLSTTYIGQAVEQYNSNIVKSAQVIPGTTQVRFMLNNNLTLMYDYYYQQWGTHTNLQAVSSTLYNNLHTYLNQYGHVLQETPGVYLDGSTPVLMSFTSAWINLAGLQGFERFYFMYLLGTYYSPFKLNVSIGYNYNSGPMQNIVVTPDNNTPNWGGETVWGAGSNWGGGQGTQSSADSSANVFAARIFPAQQKCSSFQITVTEIFDRSIGQPAGQGLSLSGLNLVVGGKRGFRTQRASTSFG